MFGKKKKNKLQGPDSFVIQIPARHTKAAFPFGSRKVEKIVAEWAKKGYRLHSMTPISSGIFHSVTHYALNFHKADTTPQG